MRSKSNQLFSCQVNWVLHALSLFSITLLIIVFQPIAKAEESKTEQGAFIGAVDVKYPNWFKVSFMELEDDVAEAAAEGKRLMLIFHQSGCPYCNAFVEQNLAQKDIENTLKTKFDVIEMNMWGDREVVSVGGETYSEKEFAKALSVQFTPTVLFLSEQGKVALRLNGFYGPERFRLALEYVTNKLEEQQTFSDFLDTKSVPATEQSLVNRKYFTGPIEQLSDRPGAGKKPLLLLFEQGDCRDCKTLHDKILSKPESQALLSEFDVYQVDMWGTDSFKTPAGSDTSGRQWSKELNVSYAPTMILYAADGTEVIRSESFFRTFHTQSIMDYVVSDAWREQASFQRYISARADEFREEGIDVNIWDKVD